MNKIEETIEKFVKPSRINYSNLIFNEKEYFQYFERIDFGLKTFDTKNLSVTLFKNKSSSKNDLVCVYSHTHGSCKAEGAFLLRHCYNNSMSLCIYDSRGCGESSEGYLTFGQNERVDLLFLLMKLSLTYDLKSVLLWGRSIGVTSICQMFYLIVSNEGEFLNKRIEIQKNPLIFRSEMTRSKSRGVPSMNNLVSNQIIDIVEKKYPSSFNSFVYKYFETFCTNNNINYQYNMICSIKIIGAIFDSPYSCVSDFIADNINKSIKFMQTIASSLAVFYFKNWSQSKLELDIEKNQNVDLFPKMNLNSAFIISQSDELIPFERYQKLVKSYGEKCVDLQKPVCVILTDRHTATRKHDMVQPLLAKFFDKMIEQKCFHLNYVHLDYKKLIAEKFEKVVIPTAIQLYTPMEVKSEVLGGYKKMTRNKTESRNDFMLSSGGVGGIELWKPVDLKGLSAQNLSQSNYEKKNDLEMKQMSQKNE